MLGDAPGSNRLACGPRLSLRRGCFYYLSSTVAPADGRNYTTGTPAKGLRGACRPSCQLRERPADPFLLSAGCPAVNDLDGGEPERRK